MRERNLTEFLRDTRIEPRERLQAYLNKRSDIGTEHRSIFDRLVCSEFSPLPSKPDGKSWTTAWNVPNTLCATGLPSGIEVEDAVSDLLNIDNLCDPDDEGGMDSYYISKAILLQNKKRHIEGSGPTHYHFFHLPFTMENGVFSITFSWILGGQWGGLVGLAEASSGKPVLAFDISSCSNSESLGFLIREVMHSRICSLKVPEWSGTWVNRYDDFNRELKETQSPVDSERRMTLVVDIEGERLQLYAHQGPVQESDTLQHVATIDKRNWRRIGARRSKESTVSILRDAHVFFAISADEEDCQGGEGRSIVRIERILPTQPCLPSRIVA